MIKRLRVVRGRNGRALYEHCDHVPANGLIRLNLCGDFYEARVRNEADQQQAVDGDSRQYHSRLLGGGAHIMIIPTCVRPN